MIRGTFLFDLDFADQWDSELKHINLERIYIPLPGMKFMMLWKQHLDYRGIARSMQSKGLLNTAIIQPYGTASMTWYRAWNMQINRRYRHEDRQRRIIQDMVIQMQGRRSTS